MEYVYYMESMHCLSYNGGTLLAAQSELGGER